MVDSITNPAAAAGSYANIAKVGTGADTAGKPSFTDFMKEGVTDFMSTMKTSEMMAGKAVAGQANTIDVVRAVNAADLSIQTLIAVRDKMVGAYTEIMRMQM